MKSFDSSDLRSNYVSLPAFARIAGISERTVQRKIRSGELTASKVFGRWRVCVSELERLLNPRSGHVCSEHAS